MSNQGHYHDLITFGSMIKGLLKARKSNQIPTYVAIMAEEQIRLDEMFVKTLLYNRNEEVQSVMALLRKNGMYISNDVQAIIDSIYKKI